MKKVLGLVFVMLATLAIILSGAWKEPGAQAQSANDPSRPTVVRVGPALPLNCNPAAGNTLFNLTLTDGSSAPGIYRCSGGTWSGPLAIAGATRTASLDFTALAANSCEQLDIGGFSGLVDAGVVALGLPSALVNNAGAATNTTFVGFVKNATTVTLRRCNVGTAATFDPAAANVRVTVTPS